jgi:hypothetical protein
MDTAEQIMLLLAVQIPLVVLVVLVVLAPPIVVMGMVVEVAVREF